MAARSATLLLQMSSGGCVTTASQGGMTVPYRISFTLAAVMAAQSGLGLLTPDQYRDSASVLATWFGNDSVTLALGLPLLAIGLLLDRRDIILGRLLWLGALGYAMHNYSFYLFGAALNVFFPLYLSAFLLALIGLILTLARTDVDTLSARFRSSTPVRWIGAYLVLVAAGMSIAWMSMWAAHLFAGRPTPIAPEEFKLVAALDLTIMAPALASGGILLWRRYPWGYLIATAAGLQGSLYLLVLTVNSVGFIIRGSVAAPGELPVWGALALTTAVATALLLMNVRGRWRHE